MKTLVKSNGSLSAVPKMFDDFFMRDFFNVPGLNNDRGSLPSVNIRETEKSFELEVAAPGMKKEDFSIELERDLLTISAQKEEQKDETQGKYTRKEFSYSSFKRSYTLPERVVDGDNISARYIDGVLLLSIPKTKEAVKPTRRIDIE
jgi:HSP20 family protein